MASASSWPADPFTIETELNGGYITGTYSQQVPNVDAIQLENGRYLRTWGRRSYARDLAKGIKIFYDIYLIGEAHNIDQTRIDGERKKGIETNNASVASTG